ncbi:MAG: selenocysteine-specific elongation factor [Blastocatellia bacterium]|jgi:selenocysteine-specific elongation factor|nr:selenocysteine-specific elongation factor [Blastocatellia bacterium]
MITKSIIIGTAGHIDHGKTTLVRALTGVDADRLPEEKRRGITIDIGFADLDLGDVRVGFVDVPGHERFVKNMLAGAHGIDVVALVIAADESVMPQTREHFDICRLLDVRKGLIILTKKDLVDEELLELVRSEIEELVAGSFLEGAPIIAVSSRTGEGIETLKAKLRETGLEVASRSADFVTRLPIDRAFTMRGFGAVVTGTLIAGEIAEGSELELLPAATRVRVRGVQVHGSSVPRAIAGQRTAINLGGVETAAIERGMVLAPAGRLRPTGAFDAQVNLLENAPRPLRSRQRVRVHIGAAEVLARVRVLADGGEIKPGQRGFVQLRTETPIVAVLGDRFILRSYSPQITIGGGLILEPFSARHRARDIPNARARLEILFEGGKTAQLARFVANAEGGGLRRADMAARTGWRDEVIEAAVKKSLDAEAIVDVEGILLDRKEFDEFKQLVVDEVAAHHRREPLLRGLGKEVLRERCFAHAPIEVFRGVLAVLEKEDSLVAEKEIVRLREHTRELSNEDASLRDRLEKIYQDAGLSAPSLQDALQCSGAPAQQGRKILQLLIDSGRLVQVQGEMYMHRAALDELTMKVRDHGARQSDRGIDVAAFKDLAGISRKYAIPLLEYFDRQRVTRREGDRRIVL